VIERFAGFLGETKSKRDLSTLQASDVARFRDREAKELSRSTANLGVKVLRICLGEAVRQGLLAVVPAVRVKLLKSTAESKRRAFTLNEIKRILSACGDDMEWRPCVVRPISRTAPWRLGEIDLARSGSRHGRDCFQRAEGPAGALCSRWCSRSLITWRHSQRATTRTLSFSLLQPAQSAQHRCRINSEIFSFRLDL